MITANSQPNYDEWGWDDYWSCEDWVEWHKALKNAYGQSQANQTFVQAFHQASFGASSYDCRTFNTAFRTYAKDNGILDALYQGIGVLMIPAGSAIEIGGNIVGLAVNTSSLLKKIVPLIIILVMIIFLVYLSRKTQIL